MVIDGQGTTFTLDGVAVGGIERYTFSQGDSREVVHRPLSSDTTKWLPGQVSYGTLTLELYRDDSDPGQVKLLESRRQRLVLAAVLTLKDGTSKLFPTYVRNLPLTTGISSVNRSNVVLRIAGAIQ